MDQFLLVFNEKARDILLSEGYELLKTDKRNNIFVFRNEAAHSYALKQVSYITTNTLTF